MPFNTGGGLLRPDSSLSLRSGLHSSSLAGELGKTFRSRDYRFASPRARQRPLVPAGLIYTGDNYSIMQSAPPNSGDYVQTILRLLLQRIPKHKNRQQ